ncbi:hypothetical protein [Xenorhabdus stockiae]|uniref:hypothetical protein n=1 Tax=Xenorhabdus stockiae TaxID=351614 RepID=UPI0040628E10
MDSTSLTFASYWRNSLADAIFGKGAFKKEDKTTFSPWHASGIATGRLDKEIVNVILRPQVFVRLIQHGKERTSGAPQIVTPLVTTAVLSREGDL